MTNQTLTNLLINNIQKATDKSSIKLLIFALSKLTLALPVDKVKKVHKYTPLHGSGMSHVNLTHIGQQELTVVDLHQKLFKINQDQLTETGGYFIITKPVKNSYNNLVEECLGIRVMETPSLIDISLAEIRTIPNSYRYADTLKIASHVTLIPQEDGNKQTVFILDLECLI